MTIFSQIFRRGRRFDQLVAAPRGAKGDKGDPGAPVDFLITLADHGGVADAREVRDAAMNAGSAILTSVSAGFAAGDVGKRIVVGGAGAAGAKLSTVIASRQSGTQVTLAAPATTAVAGKGAVWGTDCSAALQSALNDLNAAKGGTLVVDGLYLLGSPVARSFGGETSGLAVRLAGTGTDSGLWIGTAGDQDAVTLSGGVRLDLTGLNFIGVPDASLDAQRVLVLTGTEAALDRCGFFGLMGADAIVHAGGGHLSTRHCLFGGSYVAGEDGYVHSVVENADWLSYEDDASQFIDYGYFRSLFYSKSGFSGTLAWVRADSPFGEDGARTESVFRLRGTRLDEGAIWGIVVKPTEGRVHAVSIEGVRHNVSSAETARGLHCERVDRVTMSACSHGWAATTAKLGHFEDCGTVLIDGEKLTDSVDEIVATNVTALILRDSPGLATFTFDEVGFRPVDSSLGELALIKDGAISDADFDAPPTPGVIGFDRSAGRLYLRGTADWVYFAYDGGNLLGPELVVNGTFAAGTADWTADEAALSVVAGKLRVTNSGTYGQARQVVPVETGRDYLFAGELTAGTSSAQVRVGTTAGGAEYGLLAATGTLALAATADAVHVALIADTEAAGNYADFDNISLRAV